MGFRLLWLAVLFVSMTSRGAVQSVQNALAVGLTRDDFPALSHGVQTGYLAKPFRGDIRGSSMGEFRFDALQYEFSLSDLQLTPRHGGVRVTLNLRNASIHFNTLFIRQNIQCHGLRATSFGNAIPVTLELSPRLTGDHRLSFEVREVNVDVNSRNFRFQSLQGCSGLGLLNGIVERIVLQTANTMQAKVRKTVTAQVVQQAALVNAMVDTLFEMDLRLPGLSGPAASLLAGLKIFPSLVDIDGDHVYLVLGTSFTSTGQLSSTRRGLRLSELRAFRPIGNESFVALSADLVNLALQHANERGFFKFTLNAKTVPSAKPFLNVAAIHTLIPDSIERFDPEAPLEMQSLGVEDFSIVPRQATSNRIELKTRFEDFKLRAIVNGQRYYDLRLNGEIPVNLRLNRKNQHLELALPNIGEMQLIEGAFVTGLQPPPLPDSGASEITLDDYLVALNSLFTGNDEPTTLVDLRLPFLNFGYAQVLYRDLLVDKPFIAMGFRFLR